ncbi:PHD-zinc-finger like domain-containing protein [Pavlovales sp. CCMP2436]|nr:PHD-zinc-finger like domain-containing protein [Pavlovales sp. CCMP2436]
MSALADEPLLCREVGASPTTSRTTGDRYEDVANCMICGDGESEDDNVILFCDGCNLAVHQVCYGGGAVAIPDGPWYCDRCDPARCAGPVECCLCPEKGGALKRTTDWRWAHVVCALWVPNVSFVDPESRDAIDLFGMDEKRFALSCGLCGVQKGACIQCKERKCMRAFHVTCARKNDLHMTEKERDDWVEFSVYCDKHKPKPANKRRRKLTA